MAELKNEPKIDPKEVLDGIIEWVTIESPSHNGKAVNVVVAAAKTGKIGDGKVFVLPVEHAVRIRTEEIGEKAV